MENATKALLIAAGVLVGIILISLIMVSHRQISNYYATKENAAKFEQLTDFNKQYIPYDRDDVRGTDLISLVNKIIDFNNLKDGERIEITINPLKNNGNYKSFYYDYDSNKNVKLLELDKTYQEPSITGNSIRSFLTNANTIEEKYPKGMANKLANNLTVLFITDPTKPRNREKFLEENKVDDTGDTLTNDILKYYQYMQFKRAHFDCKGQLNSPGLTYTTEGRVKKFTFKFNGKFE